MTMISFVERHESVDRAATWIVAHRRRFTPTLWLLAALAPLAAFWFVPLLLQDSWVRDARAAHAAWIETGKIPNSRAMAPSEFLTGLRQLGPPPHLPDLSPNGLHIGQISFVPPIGGRPGAIHVGYANEAGCHISIWITPTTESGVGRLVEQHKAAAFSWYVGGLRYVIVRSGMRFERFNLLAKSARETTLARNRLVGPKKVALAMSALFGRPCTS